MSMVICGECKKRYDFDKDDFCPRCGAYNPPIKQRAAAVPPVRSREKSEVLCKLKDIFLKVLATLLGILLAFMTWFGAVYAGI